MKAGEPVSSRNGYEGQGIALCMEQGIDFEIKTELSSYAMFICDIKTEKTADSMMWELHFRCKLIDELAKGKTMDKILRK